MSNVRLAVLAAAVPCGLVLGAIFCQGVGRDTPATNAPSAPVGPAAEPAPTAPAYRPEKYWPWRIIYYEGCDYIYSGPGSGVCHSETCPNPIHTNVEL